MNLVEVKWKKQRVKEKEENSKRKEKRKSEQINERIGMVEQGRVEG